MIDLSDAESDRAIERQLAGVEQPHQENRRDVEQRLEQTRQEQTAKDAEIGR